MLLALAYPPARLLLPVFVGLTPLLVFIAERPTGLAGRWSATRAGILMGLVYFGIQLYWVALALSPQSVALAVPAYLLFVAILAGFTGAFAWALHYTIDRLRLPLAFPAAILWTTLEWTQGRLGDLAFPWLGLGHALAPFPHLAGAADLVGARGLTLWIAAVNGLLAMALVRYRAAHIGGARPPGSARPPGGFAGVRLNGTGSLVAAALFLMAVPATYGAWRSATLELRPAARVAVVQPNIPQAIRRDHALTLESSIPVLTRLTLDAAGHTVDGGAVDGRAADGRAADGRAAAGGSLELVVWPEVALTADLAGDASLVGWVSELSRQAGAPILVGAFGVDRAVTFNSAFLVGDDGLLKPRYDKRRLVAFVERVPFIDPARLASRSERPRFFGGLGRGTTAPVFRSGGVEQRATTGAAFGVLICFESAFADLARGYRRDGADFLVNITNDAWFGREPWYARTTALWQHPAHMTMRAIETRMGVARAANTGISMFIDPLGRVHQPTPLFVDDARIHTVLTTDSTTLFVRWGDWLATLAALAAGALLLAARLKPAGLRG